MIAAGASGSVLAGMTGPDRAMLYTFALATGFRKNECASPTTASFFLVAKHPTVLLSGASAKDKRSVYQPLPWQSLPALRK